MIRRSLEALARQWIVDNPEAWRMFCRLTRDVIDVGFRHYSARTIVHTMRWHTDIQTRDPDGWKVNNNLSPYLGREFERVHPEHKGFFRKRRVSGSEPVQGELEL